MNYEEQQIYIEFLEEILILSRQKEDYFQKVLENYGSYKADDYLKKIKEAEQTIQLKMASLEKIRYEIKELQSKLI